MIYFVVVPCHFIRLNNKNSSICPSPHSTVHSLQSYPTKQSRASKQNLFRVVNYIFPDFLLLLLLTATVTTTVGINE